MEEIILHGRDWAPAIRILRATDLERFDREVAEARRAANNHIVADLDGGRPLPRNRWAERRRWREQVSDLWQERARAERKATRAQNQLHRRDLSDDDEFYASPPRPSTNRHLAA